MRSTTYTPGFEATEVAARPARPSLFKSIYSGLIAGQEARARAMVRRHVAQYDDAQLEQLGWTKAEIADLRRHR